MRCASSIAISILFLAISGCGGPVSSRVVREQIRTLGGANLPSDDVSVERVIAQAGDRVIAEATVQMAFEFARNTEGEWTIVAVRVAEDEWIDMATFLAALEARQIEETTSNLEMLANGLAAFQRDTGSLPQVSDDLPLPDVLHPLYVPDLVRRDAWGSAFIYEPLSDAVFIRSSGPDRQPGTDDDIEVMGSRLP